MTGTAALPQPDARHIARMVSVPQMLRQLGWPTRPRSRADCGLCRGHSRGTVAYRERVWHCHRCQAGGDVYALVRAAQRCDFAVALRYVADVAGVRLADSRSADMRRELAERHRQRERIDTAADVLEQIERELRLVCRDQIHVCDRLLSRPGPWSEAHWQRAQSAHVLLRDHLLPAYTLLSFGDVADRARYVLANGQARAEMCISIRDAGGVRADDGGWVEVLA